MSNKQFLPQHGFGQSLIENITEKTRTDTDLRMKTQDRNLDLKELQNELGCKG